MIIDYINEEWKEVIGFEGFYKVSNMGRVKSLEKTWKCGHINGTQHRTIEEKIRKTYIEKDGYVSVILIANKKREKWLLHRLVAIHFIENKNNLPTVNHKNGDKKDNRASQLEWLSFSDNHKHAYKTGLKVSAKGGENKNAKIVLNISNGIFYNSAKEAWQTTNYKKYQTFTNKLCGKKRNDTSMIYV